MISQKSVTLVPIDPKVGELIKLGTTSLERQTGIWFREETLFILNEVVAVTLAMMKILPRDREWGGFVVADDETKEVVGTCGFKTGPDEDGVIELSYFTFPFYERKGYATAMARALVEKAEGSSLVTVIRAHTLPQQNASTRILEKLGFRFIGAVDDPEDGRVWRWELI